MVLLLSWVKREQQQQQRRREGGKERGRERNGSLSLKAEGE